MLSRYPTQPDLSLQLVSLTPLLNPCSLTRPTADSLLAALRSSGFLYLTDSPIPASLLSRVFSLSAAFFGRPRSQKEALAWTTPRSNRGYTRPGREKTSSGATKAEVDADRTSQGDDMKESFEIGREGDEDGENRWPDQSEAAGVDFKRTMMDFFTRCKTLHAVVMRAIALGMGLDETFFDRFVRKGNNTLRLLHYPPVSNRDFQAGRIRAGAHSDIGSITLLFQDEAGGLQVEKPGQPGVFVDVRPLEGAIVLNSADLLARWTNDVIRSTIHRVVQPPPPLGDAAPTKKAGAELQDHFYSARYSVAYFCNPDFDGWIETIPGTYGGDKGERKYEGINAGDYLEERLAVTY